MTNAQVRIARPGEYWRGIVNASCGGLTPIEFDRVVGVCVDTDAAGAPVGAWHAMSVVLGTVCHCAPCRTQRAALAKLPA